MRGPRGHWQVKSPEAVHSAASAWAAAAPELSGTWHARVHRTGHCQLGELSFARRGRALAAEDASETGTGTFVILNVLSSSGICALGRQSGVDTMEQQHCKWMAL